MIDATGEEGDSDEEKEETEAPPAECPAHKPATKTKGVMTDEEIVANSFGFLFAGNETTASALSFASYCLALHPDIQEKLQSEIDAYFDEKPVSSITIVDVYCFLLLVLKLILLSLHYHRMHRSTQQLKRSPILTMFYRKLFAVTLLC